MPGEVIEAHSKIESECDSCHEKLNRSGQDRKCRVCHEMVEADLVNGRGYHGRAAAARQGPCRSCHPEHQGRDAEIAVLEEASFDHDETEFRLLASHRAVDCSSCHGRGARYRDADPSCSACHQKEEPHGGALGAACQTCHDEESWRIRHFDHQQSDFPLRGGHRVVACTACHSSRVFVPTTTRCADCHAISDPHRNGLGEACQNCHSEQSWKIPGFDHETGKFRLRGKHVGVACQECHSTQVFVPTDQQCVACHSKSDVHSGRFGPACESCHAVTGWKTTGFPHRTRNGFSLDGAHALVPCHQCHQVDVDVSLPPTRCFGCHGKDDEHGGRFGSACERCHGGGEWISRFDHDAETEFPLVGRHRSVECNTCHVESAPEPRLGKTCATCHQKDDVHGGQQGSVCSACHNERGWRDRVFFDHDLTRFPLIAAHGEVGCTICHASTTFKDAEIECVSCHVSADPHAGVFGTKCGECHNPTGWDTWHFDHDETGFALDGEHGNLRCVSCHGQGAKAARLPVKCGSCHERDDVHSGEYGRDCERCHDTSSFRAAR